MPIPVMHKPIAAIQSRNRVVQRLTSRGRKRSLHVVAFRRDVDPLLQAATQFPTMFHVSNAASLEDIVSDRLMYRTSFWYHDLVENKGRHRLGPGLGPYENSLRTVLDAYTQRKLNILEAMVDPEGKNAFLLYGATLENTGKFLADAPTGRLSSVAGAYRLKYDENNRICDVWLYRTGTEEEREHLLKDSQLASGKWIENLNLYPMTWASSRHYKQLLDLKTECWHREVVSRGDLKKLGDLVAPDVQYYDGVAFTMARPLVGLKSLGEFLATRHSQYSSGGVLPLAQASCEDSNRVFTHWTHTLLNRGSALPSPVNGVTLLVFDSEARIVQIVDFAEPTREQREAAYKERHLVPTH